MAKGRIPPELMQITKDLREQESAGHLRIDGEWVWPNPNYTWDGQNVEGERGPGFFEAHRDRHHALHLEMALNGNFGPCPTGPCQNAFTCNTPDGQPLPHGHFRMPASLRSVLLESGYTLPEFHDAAGEAVETPVSWVSHFNRIANHG